MMTAVFNFLMITGAIQGFVFNIGTFLLRRKIERPVVFLNLFVLFLSLNNLQSWLIDKGFYADQPFWRHITVPWYVLIVPMFYAFLLAYLKLPDRSQPFLRLTGGIFVFELLARILTIAMARSGRLGESVIGHYNIAEDILTLGYSLFLFYKAFRILFGSKGLSAPIVPFDDLRWLRRFMLFGGFIFLLWILAIVFSLTGWVGAPYNYYPLRLGSSILIYWVGYQAFIRYVIATDRVALRSEIRNKVQERNQGPDPNRIQVDRQERDGKIFQEVDDYIRKHKVFLDPLLSLEQLAMETNRGTSTLSRVINTHSKGNFSDYINGLRVDEAKQLLADPSFASYTVIAIGLECGFNSKSTFYSAFAKFVGKTPSDYRKHATW